MSGFSDLLKTINDRESKHYGYENNIYPNTDTLQNKVKPKSYNKNNNIGYQKVQTKTDGYWKDLETPDTKVMILSIPNGTFITTPDNPKKEYSFSDVNGKFLILDGLLYKSNTDSEPIVYMKV